MASFEVKITLYLRYEIWGAVGRLDPKNQAWFKPG